MPTTTSARRDVGLRRNLGSGDQHRDRRAQDAREGRLQAPGRDLAAPELVRDRAVPGLPRSRMAPEIHDLADVPVPATAELDAICAQIEANIREDQVDRIGQYRNERNAEEADALTHRPRRPDRRGDRGPDRAAARRALRGDLRDRTRAARSRDFTPDFLAYAASAEWPPTDAALRAGSRLAQGPSTSRRTAARPASHSSTLYRDDRRLAPDTASPTCRRSGRSSRKSATRTSRSTISGRSGAPGPGRHALPAHRAIRSDGWFLPPVFGSQGDGAATASAAGRRDVLPENVMKALSPDMPADHPLCRASPMLARRHELAERLRAERNPGAPHRRGARRLRRNPAAYPGANDLRVRPALRPRRALHHRCRPAPAGDVLRPRARRSATSCRRRPMAAWSMAGASSANRRSSATWRARPHAGAGPYRRPPRGQVARQLGEDLRDLDASRLDASPDIVKPASRDCRGRLAATSAHGWCTSPEGRIVVHVRRGRPLHGCRHPDDYPELSRLKELMEDTGRAFKVVFAGLHNVQRMYRQPNSPLAHLGRRSASAL